MDRDTKLKEFAAALFSHVFREYNTIFDLPVKLPHVFSHHPPHDSSGEEAAAVLRLCLALRGVFNGLFVTSFETFQQSTEQFMTFLTSRALRLCSADDGDDVFLAFCMVCAFIAELNLFCIINGCFAFMSTAPKCLQAIFNRRLRKEFFASGGWEALKCWSEHFAGNVLPEEVVSDDLLESIKKKLTEAASSSSSDDEEDEEEEDLEEEPEDTDDDDEEGEDKPKEPEEAKADGPSNQSNPGTSNSQPSAVISSDEEDSDEISSESESDSEEDEEESKPTPRANGQKRPHVDTSDDDSEEDSEQEVRHNGVTKRTKVSEDDESDSEEEEESDETSSMSEEDSEGESEEDSPVKEKVQTNSVKPIVQGNVTADKEVL
ncbi:hypothetical protein JTE90_007946 [Oedothorax gibbosus]|uniref:Uncharacterized protein n=1 Tax=Oedothorax gibbosus TaxID=931172 RepID=A0AAV6VJZ3_9ARAC|nr:hypothetical protein JTE90_007946 [Oedothorax gibbosus]